MQLHIDDVGVSSSVTSRLLDLCEQVSVKGVSILPTTSGFDSVMVAIRNNIDLISDVQIFVHVDFFEGPSISSSFHKPFSKSFLHLFFQAIFRYEKVKNEVLMQLVRVRDNLPKGINIYGIDSHRHAHSMPFVLNIFKEVAHEQNIIEVRSFKEPLKIAFSAGRSFRFFGFLRTLVLWLFSLAMHFDNYIFGIYCSGRLDDFNIKNILSSRHLSEEGRFRLICHPLRAKPSEFDINHPRKFVRWHTSKRRDVENESILRNFARKDF
jgi:hypothetical protein